MILRDPRRAATAAFVLHGAGTLVLESVWVRQQVLLLGSSPEAYASVLVAYFLGAAAGSWLWRAAGPRRVGGWRFVFGLAGSLALSVAVPGLLATHLDLLTARPLLAPLAGRQSLLVLTTLLLALPGVFLGGFLPAVARLAPGRDFVPFYAAQTAGALVGAALGAALLPSTVGFRATAGAGTSLLLAAVLLVRLAGVSGRPPGAGTVATASPFAAGPQRLPGRLLLLVAGSGACSLMLQGLWIRLVSLASDNSVYAFAAVSGLSIALYAAAGLLVAALPQRLAAARAALPLVLSASVAGAAAAAGLWLRLTDGLGIRLVQNAEGLAVALGRAAPLVLVGTAGASLLFPLALRLAAARHPPAESVVGPLVAVNALGCALGIAATPLLLTALGLWPTLLAALAGYLALLAATPAGPARGWAAAVGVATILLADPLHLPLVTPTDPFGGPRGTVVSVREGRYGIVSVIDYPGRIRSLWLNNTYLLEAAAGNPEATLRLGLFPTVLRPGARSIAMIGVGTGVSASGFLGAGAERILLIEMIPEVAAAAREHFGGFNSGILHDPSVRLVLADGRRHLAADPARHDIVCCDVITPWNEGAALLYSLEHFRTVRRRLNPGGIAVVWLPLYQLAREEFLVIARTMAEVFPAVTLWQLGSGSAAPVVALVGAERVDVGAIASGLARRAGDEREDALLVHESGILSHYVGPVERAGALLRGVPVSTVDRPRLEYLAARGGRTVLRGEAYLALLAEFFSLPGNPGGRYFADYDERVERWRAAGWAQNRYFWHMQRGEHAAAAQFEAAFSDLPAYQEPRGPGGRRAGP